MRGSISIILPAYNEESGIQKTLKSLPVSKLKKNGYKVEVIVINNNSTDKTKQVAAKLGAKVVLESKQGYGYAYKKGFKVCTGEFIICLDSDGTYPGDIIPKIINLMHKSYDIVLTNRFHTNDLKMPLLNKVGNIILSYLTKIIFLLQITDSQSGMWGIKKDLLNQLNLSSNSMALSQELKIKAVYYHKAKWIEIPINYSHRMGKAKLNPLQDGVNNMFRLFLLRFHL